MTIRVTSFASGSSGNALLVEADGSAVLVDCGLPQRTLERQLRRVGLSPSDLTAVLLTHEHGDHALSAGPLARRNGIPVVVNGATAAALGSALDGVVIHELATGSTTEIGRLAVQSFPVPHDAADPVGYTIRTSGCCVGIAVDLGCWDAQVLGGLEGADLVVLEANHDLERLRVSRHPWPIKQRIFGRLGHLDNMEAGALLAQLGADGRRRTAWLAHLSEHANSPQIAVGVVSSVLSLASVSCINIQALPRRAPLTWESDHHLQQLELFPAFM